MSDGNRQQVLTRSAYWSLLILSCFWALTRLYPLTQVEPAVRWEVLQARRLLDYGFLNRKGALLETGAALGRVSEPSRFNYVHHPSPSYWLFAAVCRFAGGWGITALIALTQWGSCLAVFLILRRQFDRTPSFLAAAGYALSPVTTYLSVETNVSLVGALWIGALLVIGPRGPTEPVKARQARWLALLVFVAGQIDWMAYTIVPCLLIISVEKRHTLRETIRANSRGAAWRWILGSWMATIVVYVAQIVLYKANWSYLLTALRDQTRMPSHGNFKLFSNLEVLPLKVAILVGPALLLGLCMGLWVVARRGERSPLIQGCTAYLIVFAATAVVLSTYFTREAHMYYHLAFPLACLTAFGLQHLPNRWLQVAFIALLAPGAFIGSSYAAYKQHVSETAREMASCLSRVSRPGDLVITNLRTQEPPLARGDEVVLWQAAFLADRNFREGVRDLRVIEKARGIFAPDQLRVIYVRNPEVPIEDRLEALLHTKCRLIENCQITVARPHEALLPRLRAPYLRWTGRGPGADMATTSAGRWTLKLEVYELPAEMSL